MNPGWVGGEDFLYILRVLDDSGQARTTPRVGFTGGIVFIIGFVEYFALQPELLYTSLGGRYEHAFFGIEVDGLQTAGVLEIPIFLKFRIPLSYGAFCFSVGPDIAVFLSNVSGEERSAGLVFVNEAMPHNAAVLSLAAGFGYEHILGPGRPSFDAKIAVSFTEIFDGFQSNLSAPTFMIGYAFELARSDENT